MKKITFLLLHLNYGGIEKQVTTLANNLCDDYEVEIISVYDILAGKSFYTLDERIKVKFILDRGPNKKEFKEALSNHKYISLIKEGIKGLKIAYIRYFYIKNIIKKIDTDVLISSRIEFSKYIKRKDIITISQEHSYITDKKYIKKVKKSFKGINYLVVMTNKAKEVYELWLSKEKKRPKIVVIPNMIKENIDNRLSKLDNNQIIGVGRLEKVKDFPSLILAFNILKKDNPSLKLKIIGDGSQRNRLSEMIKEYDLEDSITLTGRLTEEKLNEEMLKSDVFVLTSLSESFSLILCEAMNYGLPCVSFDIDVGPREIINENTTGYLIQDRNIELLAEKINELLKNDKKRKEMGKEASQDVKRFYPQNIIKLWKELF